jgi:hypothetical protein
MRTTFKATVLTTSFVISCLFIAGESALAQFPAKGDDVTQTLGQFTIVINPAFQPLMAGYPGYNGGTMTLTSPVLYDPATIIGRSSAVHDGDAADVGGIAVGTAGTIIGEGSLTVMPGGLGPAGTREVHTEIRMMNMTGGGSAVRAGTAAADQPISPGEVESWSGPAGLPPADFPAKSFFDVFVDVDLPAGGTAGFPGATLYNGLPLLVMNTNLTHFPPEVVYIHGMSTAVPIYFRTGNPPMWNAGDIFGILTLAGHGVVGTNSVGNATAQLLAALAATQPAPVEPPYIGWAPGLIPANPNKIFPNLGDDTTTSLGTFTMVINPAFQPFMPGYPGYNPSTKRLTSPTLFDPGTIIGRSSPIVEGSPADLNGTQVGSVGLIVSDSDMPIPPFESAPNIREVHTIVESLNLSGSGFSVRAGNAAPGLQLSAGEVESLSGPSGDPYWDFPARSFFDVFVDVSLPAGGPIPTGFSIRNAQPLVVQNQNLTAFPPKVIYIHGNSTAVPMILVSNVPSINGHAGDVFGILMLAGHGIGYNPGSQDLAQFQQTMQQVKEEPVSPQYANWAPGLNVPLQFSKITIQPNGLVTINGYCSSFAQLFLQSSPSLANPDWNFESTAQGSSNATFTVFTTKNPFQDVKFMRMVDTTR